MTLSMTETALYASNVIGMSTDKLIRERENVVFQVLIFKDFTTFMCKD